MYVSFNMDDGTQDIVSEERQRCAKTQEHLVAPEFPQIGT